MIFANPAIHFYYQLIIINLLAVQQKVHYLCEQKKQKMEATDFYNQRLEEDSTLGTIQLMEEYAKHIIEINFCDGSPISFSKCTVEQLEKIHKNVSICVDWVNS